MPVADTCFLVDLMRRRPAAIELYTSYEEQDIALSTTVSDHQGRAFLFGPGAEGRRVLMNGEGVCATAPAASHILEHDQNSLFAVGAEGVFDP